MSLLSYNELVGLVSSNVISGVDPENINGASVDVTLGDVVWLESPHGGRVSLADKVCPALNRYTISAATPLVLFPGDFAIAGTREVFNLPDNIAGEFRLKSSLARAGLQHALAGHCDPGWCGSVLTLELSNSLRHHQLELVPGMKIGQVLLHRVAPVPLLKSYATRGQYNGDSSAQPSRGVR